MKEIKVKRFEEVPENYTGIAIYPDGTKRWYKNGKRHREDGPAVVFVDGTEYWYKNGKRHNDNGPAIVHPNGSKSWFKNGQRHNENGPAIIYSNGNKYWFLNGEELTKTEFKIKTCKLMRVLNGEKKNEMVK